jgi:hypothetical protein
LDCPAGRAGASFTLAMMFEKEVGIPDAVSEVCCFRDTLDHPHSRLFLIPLALAYELVIYEFLTIIARINQSTSGYALRRLTHLVDLEPCCEPSQPRAIEYTKTKWLEDRARMVQVKPKFKSSKNLYRK